MTTTFDYIIVGAGSAGCVVANRLSANPKTSVCLIEAGGSDKSPLVKIPAGGFVLYGSKKYDYTFKGAPQKHLDNRVITVNRGKGLGGSSSINSMVYIRGNKNDYDTWAKMGCKGWGYDDVLPVFKQLENNQAGQSAEYHGFDGELMVSEQQDANQVADVFVAAGSHAGLPENNDFNAEQQLGLGIYQVKQNKGRRMSSYTAFVEPVRSRENLTVLTHTEVFSVVLKDGQAVGVNIEQAGRRSVLHCNKEVIISAGTIASPRILLASGIGDKTELSALNIDCQHHLPGVGQNLQDHIDSMVTVRSSSSDSIGVSWATLLQHVLPAPLKYWLGRKGWWTTNYTEAGGFAKTKFALAAKAGSVDSDPDVQFHFTPLFRSHRGKRFEFGHGYSLFTCVLRPKSIGSVKLADDGTHKNVVIDHNFFANEQDQRLLVEAVRTARKVLASPEFDHLRGEEMAPGESVQTDEEILAYLRATASTVYHPVGTCKMGVDKQAVVAPDSLKVHGLEGLRVIDASIMPNIISGNTSAPTMMIGEKGAQMVLNDS